MAAYRHLFGPVSSRRFGRSLGVDLQTGGRKRCTLDCRFCQLGPTPATSVQRQADVPVASVLAELDAWRQTGATADFITLSGSGEPTLHPDFGRVLDWIRENTPFRSLLLSNGTLFTDAAVRRDAARADVVKVSLHSWDAPSFRQMVRPHADLDFEAILEGYRLFRDAYAGVLIAEVFILRGFNDSDEAADRIAARLRGFAPDHVQINVLARPPADPAAAAVAPERLRELARRFTPAAELPDTPTRLPPWPPAGTEQADALAALACRHPADLAALARTFGFAAAPDALRPLVQRLAAAGKVGVRWQGGRLHVLPPPAPVTAAASLVLGSASPRRQRLFREAGLRFDILHVDTEEIHDPADPVGTVVHNARAKHAACRARRPDAVIVTADTLVWFDGRLIGKPADIAEAARFLRDFSGRTQTVFTAVAFSRPGDAEPALRIEASRVRFRTLDAATITAYLDRTTTLDRAGAYDIDEHGELLIASYEGSYTNIVGIPMESVRDWLRHHAPDCLNG